MKIYLDIYGTLLKPEGFTLKPAKHLKNFLTNLLDKHDVYWLSTHCDGDTAEALNFLSRYLDDELMSLARQIKATSWRKYKIEAINFQEEFLWFDDTLNPYDRKVLEEEGVLDSFIHVKLYQNNDFLKDYLKI
jgi:hypothetical protein